MPDRTLPLGRVPPSLWDRVRAHEGPASLGISSLIAGLTLVFDAFVPWSSFSVLPPMPFWLCLLLGIPLLAGGVMGFLGLHWVQNMTQAWPLERLGWATCVAGWLCLIVVLLIFGSRALLIPLCISTGFILPGLLRLSALRDVRKRYELQQARVQGLRVTGDES